MNRWCSAQEWNDGGGPVRGFQARVPPVPERGAGGERQEVGKEVACLIHDVHHQVAVVDPDVDMHAEDQHPARNLGHALDVIGIAVTLGDVLFLPAGEGMGARRDDPQSIGLGEFADVAAQAHDLLASLGDVVADLTADFDLRLQQLGLDLVSQNHPTLLQELLDIGGQLSGFGFDELILLLDSDSELGKRHDVSPVGRTRSGSAAV
jgi:hypothetical protein